MSANHEELLKELRVNLKKLYSLYERTKSEKQELLQRNSDLEELILERDNTIKELEEQNNTIKIAKALVTGEDTHDAKIKINRIVREIDKCIALLNK